MKTLKDIYGNKANGQISVKELKQEVINWIDNPRTLRMNANDFILVFFNITEEDLK